jgi:1-deoxy-D-xylulose-5-phosphate reductoisomerase
LQLSQCASLEFLAPDYQCFPALQLAFEALRRGGVVPAVLNAANEIAVTAFLESRIGFPQIAETVSRTMDIIEQGSDESLEDILHADSAARKVATALVLQGLK